MCIKDLSVSRVYKGNANSVFAFELGNNSYKFFLKVYKDIDSHNNEIAALKYLLNQELAPKIIFSSFPIALIDNAGSNINCSNYNDMALLGKKIAEIHKLTSSNYKTISRQASIVSTLLLKHNIKPISQCFLHGDITPNNTFKNNKIMFIDWEEAGLGDPLVDLAIATIDYGILTQKVWDIVESEYFYHMKSEKLKEHWNKNRTIYLNCALEVLKSWAVTNNKEELVLYYKNIKSILK